MRTECIPVSAEPRTQRSGVSGEHRLAGLPLTPLRCVRGSATAARGNGNVPGASLTFCLGPARIESVAVSFCTACEYPSRVGTPGGACRSTIPPNAGHGEVPSPP